MTILCRPYGAREIGGAGLRVGDTCFRLHQMNRPHRLSNLSARLLFALAVALGATAHAVDVPNRNPAVEERALRQARASIAQKAWERALVQLQSHIRVYPDDADAHNLHGLTLRQLGRYDLSLAAYERALQLDPEHLGAHEYMGELMLTLGRRDRALHHLTTLERLCQAQCEAYLQLKKSYESPDSARSRAYDQ
jgi:tetratricopeptide (TPR) repeat protein